MTWERRLQRALDQHPDAPGTVRVDGEDGGWAEVDVSRVDRIGVRVRELRVGHAPRDVADEAERIARELRDLPDRVVPIEVDRGLGGAILRSRPGDMRRRELHEVEVTPEVTRVRKLRVTDDGREDAEMDLTRQALGGVLDTLG